MQNIIINLLRTDSEIKVIATASNGIEALKKVHTLNPDVVTLDIVMFPLDGLSVLRQIMEKHPTPVIIVSGLSKQGTSISIEALELGAVDFVAKQGGDSPSWGKAALNLMRAELLAKIKIAATIDRDRLKRMYWSSREKISPQVYPSISQLDKIVAIGSSTGGPQALMRIFPQFPHDFPATILVSQHLPSFFIRSFAERLNGVSNLKVKVTEEGEVLHAGTVLFAPGDSTLKLKKTEKKLSIMLSKETSPHYLHYPSIDIMMKSVAEVSGKKSIGVILTGMGEDGVDGLKSIKEAGGKTIAQDEKTSIIFGMPKVAIEKGVVDKVLQLEKIPEEIIKTVNNKWR